jgi:hypothetical protein
MPGDTHSFESFSNSYVYAGGSWGAFNGAKFSLGTNASNYFGNVTNGMYQDDIWDTYC